MTLRCAADEGIVGHSRPSMYTCRLPLWQVTVEMRKHTLSFLRPSGITTPPPLGTYSDPAHDVLDMPVDPNEPTYCVCHQVCGSECHVTVSMCSAPKCVVQAHSCIQLILIVNGWVETQLLIIFNGGTLRPEVICHLLTRQGVL